MLYSLESKADVVIDNNNIIAISLSILVVRVSVHLDPTSRLAKYYSNSLMGHAW